MDIAVITQAWTLSFSLSTDKESLRWALLGWLSGRPPPPQERGLRSAALCPYHLATLLRDTSRCKAHLAEGGPELLLLSEACGAQDAPRPGKEGTQRAEPDLVQGFHHAHHVVEDDHGLALAEPLLLDDVVLQVDQVGSLVAEVVGAEAVEDEADAFLHLPNHPAGFCVLNHFTRAVLGGKGHMGLAVGLAGPGQGSGTLWGQTNTTTREPGASLHVCGRKRPEAWAARTVGPSAMPGFLCVSARPSQGLRLKYNSSGTGFMS